MEWIIKANINLLLFGLIYKMIMHLTRRHTFSRVYLLLVPVLSILIPLVVSIGGEVPRSFSYVLQPVSVQAAAVIIPATSYSLLDVLSVIYATGVGISLLHSATGLFKVLVNAPAPSTAYSFFNRIFIPAVSAPHAGMMQLHEEAHVKQWHSADILFYQLVNAFFWFNPVVYLLFAYLREVQEFSADAYAVKHIDDKVSYCELLLDETFNVNTPPLSNPFHSPATILNRITMITQTQKQPVSRWRYVAVLPMLVAVFLLSATPKDLLAQEKKDKVYQDKDLPEVMPEFKGGQAAMMSYLGKKINYPADARKEKIEGRVVLKFIVDKKGNISHVENMRESVDPRLVKEAIRVVEAMPAWNPGKNKGEPVSVSFVLPVSFKLN